MCDKPENPNSVEGLPRAAQIAEAPDLFLHLARANQELGHAVVELQLEKLRLANLVEQLEAELEARTKGEAIKQQQDVPRCTREPFNLSEARAWARDVFGDYRLHYPAHFSAACGSLAIKTTPHSGGEPVTLLVHSRDVAKLSGMVQIAEMGGGSPETPAGQQVRVYEDDGELDLPATEPTDLE